MAIISQETWDITKYLKVEWPEYQDYMEHPQFRELSYYNCDNNVYFIPENLVNEIDNRLMNEISKYNHLE